MKLISHQVVVDAGKTIPTVQVTLELEAGDFDRIMEGLRFVEQEGRSVLRGAAAELYRLLMGVWLEV